LKEDDNMLPKIDPKARRRDITGKINISRIAREMFGPAWAEHAKERDAYAKLPVNPLREVHEKRGAKIKADALANVPDPAWIAEMRKANNADLRALDVRTMNHNHGRFVERDGSTSNEMLNLMLEDRTEKRFRAMTPERQAEKIKSIVDGIGYNGPTPEQAAWLDIIDYVDSTAPLSGPARSAHIAAFGGMGDNGEHNPGALEKPEKGKARAEMLDDLMEADRELRVLEGYAHAITHPESPLPVAAQMYEAALHGHMQKAA